MSANASWVVPCQPSAAVRNASPVGHRGPDGNKAPAGAGSPVWERARLFSAVQASAGVASSRSCSGPRCLSLLKEVTTVKCQPDVELVLPRSAKPLSLPPPPPSPQCGLFQSQPQVCLPSCVSPIQRVSHACLPLLGSAIEVWLFGASLSESSLLGPAGSLTTKVSMLSL